MRPIGHLSGLILLNPHNSGCLAVIRALRLGVAGGESPLLGHGSGVVDLALEIGGILIAEHLQGRRGIGCRAGRWGRTLGLELLLRLWRRSDEVPIQRAAAKNNLLLVGSPLERMVLAKHEPVSYQSWS